MNLTSSGLSMTFNLPSPDLPRPSLFQRPFPGPLFSTFPCSFILARNSIALLNQNPDDNEWQIPLARALNELGMIRMALNQLIEAEIAFEQFLTFSRRWSYLRGQGIACTNLGHVCRQLHNRTRAEECYTLGRDISLQAEHPFEAAEAIYGLGLLHLEDQTTPEQAQPFFDQALELARKTNNHDISTHIFLSRADLQQQMGNEVNPVGC